MAAGVGELNDDLQYYEELRKTKRELQKEQQELNQRIQSLEEENQALQAKQHAEREGQKRGMDELTQQLDAMQIEKQKTLTTVEEKEGHVHLLQQELSKMRLENQELRSVTAAGGAPRDPRKRPAPQQHAPDHDTAQQLAAHLAKIQELQDQNRQLANEKQVLERQCDQSVASYSKATREKRTAERAKDRATDEKTTAERQTEIWKSSFKKEKEAKETATAALEEANHEVARLKEKLENAERELEASHVEKDYSAELAKAGEDIVTACGVGSEEGAKEALVEFFSNQTADQRAAKGMVIFAEACQQFWDVKTVTEYMVKYKALEDAQTEANETAYQRQNFNEGWMLPVRHLGKIDSAEVWASIDEHCAATGEPLSLRPSHACDRLCQCSRSLVCLFTVVAQDDTAAEAFQAAL